MYWNLLDEMSSMRREMDRIFEQLNGERTPFSRMSFLPGHAARRYPLINVSEDKDNVYVEALAPGVDPQSMDISVVQNRLTISGEKKLNGDNVKAEAYHRNERAAGKFVRTIEIPMEVDPHKVTADFKNGLLMIVMPKAEKAKPKQVSVKIS